MADKFISNPNEVVKVSQRVMVTVVDVDVARKRISLTMKSGEKKVAPEKRVEKPEIREKITPKPTPKPFKRPEQKPKVEEGDMAIKLQALMGKFK
jgi:uncharacterized protein